METAVRIAEQSPRKADFQLAATSIAGDTRVLEQVPA
jgi:hypothetical protein